MRETFLQNNVEIEPSAREMSFNFFSIFSSGGHLFQWSETVLAILVQGHEMNIFVKSL